MIEIRNEEDIKKMSIDYALRALELEKQIAEIKGDIKVIRTEAKLDGVPIKFVNKAMNSIRKEMKRSEADKFEEETWLAVLSENKEIVDKIAIIENINTTDHS